MRYVLFGIPLLFAMMVPAQAQWCANYRGGGNNCGFRTFEQCQAAISGVGGICNSTSVQPERSPPARNQPMRVERSAPPAGNARSKAARQERQERQEREAKRRQQEKQERIRQTNRRQELKEKPVAFSPGDDEHIIPAEPDDEPVTQATAAQTMESETMVAPAGRPGARTGDFIAARDLVLSGNYQAGLSALQSLNQDSDPDVAAYTGYAYAKLGRTAEAKTWYEKALALDPNHLWALSYYGLLLVDEGKLQPARENLDKIKTICGGTGCFPYASLQAAISTKR
ncbi:MAG TPA: tetratricopeptide repeat protein [Xanthobacteraceae bacterium]|nr:tetratricopeptide repeat protein [Xanthobacteraceae bacterium]